MAHTNIQPVDLGDLFDYLSFNFLCLRSQREVYETMNCFAELMVASLCVPGWSEASCVHTLEEVGLRNTLKEVRKILLC